MVDALEAVGLWPTKEYIWRQKATIAEYIVNQTIYELFTGVDWMLVSSRFMWWWDQDFIWEEEDYIASKGEERGVW